jgi:hypothetical protein
MSSHSVREEAWSRAHTCDALWNAAGRSGRSNQLTADSNQLRNLNRT